MNLFAQKERRLAVLMAVLSAFLALGFAITAYSFTTSSLFSRYLIGVFVLCIVWALIYSVVTLLMVSVALRRHVSLRLRTASWWVCLLTYGYFLTKNLLFGRYETNVASAATTFGIAVGIIGVGCAILALRQAREGGRRLAPEKPSGPQSAE